MKEQFQHKNFHAKTLRLINQANAIIADMKAQGYTLTLRDAIDSVIDEDDFNVKLEQEEANKIKLEAMRDNVDDIARYLKYRETFVNDRFEVNTAEEMLEQAESEWDISDENS